MTRPPVRAASPACVIVALKGVRVGSQPGPLVITPDGRTVYVVHYGDDDGPGYVTPIRTCARR